jgi:alpha-beta hydrolase superfamily lysophospholipase
MDDSSYHEFYLINKNNLKLNILEGGYLNSPKYIVVNIHGIGSHFQPIINDECFDNFFSRSKIFRNKKIKSFALEFQGHGKSEGTMCLIDNFNNLIEDICVLIEYLNQRYPSVKKYLIAESMGGNAAIRYCVKYNNIDG